MSSMDNGECVCAEATTLGILKEVHSAYKHKLQVIDRMSGGEKLQKQVEVLQSWVEDLVDQNTLLARTVEELETEFTSKLLVERRRHSEVVSELQTETCVLRRRLSRKDADLRGLLEVLRRLREFDHCSIDGIHFHEVTESDIFGTVLWQQQNLDHGDIKKNTKHESRNRNFKLI